MATSTVNTNKPIIPRGADVRPIDSYNRAALYSGKALDFDGVNDQITLGTISDLTFGTGDFSVVLDWQIDSVSTYSWAIAKNPVTDLGIGINNTGGLLRLWIGGTLSLGTENILGSDWKKIAVVRESGVVSAYINGVAISLTETAMAGSIDSGELFVGSWVSNADFWNGLLNNIRIFNTALTAAQVADLYNNPEKVVPTGVDNTALKLWLPMQEGAGTTAYDGSGNGNHGTISGATYVHGIGAPVSQTAVMDWNKGVNALTHSEEFETLSSWSRGGVSVTANQITAPDNSTSADLITADGSTQQHYILQISSASAKTLSVFVKMGTQRYVQLLVSGTAAPVANYDLQDGVASMVGSNSTADIEDYGNDWWRISLSTTTTSTGNFYFLFVNSLTAPRFESTNSSGTAYVWGAQVENNTSTAGPYVRTGAAAQTTPVLLPQGLTTGRDITGVNLFENVRKQGALNLDGNSWAEVHDNASLDIGDFSMETWVKFNELTGTYQVLFAKDDNSSDRSFELYLEPTEDKFGATIFDSNNAQFNTSTINTTNWIHIVSTFNDTTNDWNGYINGVLNKNATIAASSNITDAPLIIGAWYTKNQFNVSGQIAQPRIYNRALTASEVLNNYNATSSLYI